MRLTKYSITCLALIALAVLVGAALHRPSRPVLRVSGQMDQGVYLWQRDWTANVRDSLTWSAQHFGRVCLLAAEIEWREPKPVITYPQIDTDLLCRLQAEHGVAIALAVRIGSYSGPFAADAPAGRVVLDTIHRVIASARAGGLSFDEIQIDFDCADARLDGYRLWLKAMRLEVGDARLTFTALPSWLNERAFARLADSADGFVLQVHSLPPPRGAEVLPPLCDPILARRAVDRAAALGRPFQVALPTYSYLLAYGPDHRLLKVIADGTAGELPPGARLRRLDADPTAMADLVRGWTIDRPESLVGITWYRLPVAGEVLNWDRRTLAAAAAGAVHGPDLRLRVERVEPGLREVQLRNEGDADGSHLATIRLTWRDGRLIAFDGLNGFTTQPGEANELLIIPTATVNLLPLKPDQQQTIAWLRLDQDEEVTAHVASISD